MSNSESISQQISLVCSLIKTRRFDDRTLRILESVLISRDVKSLLNVRSSLKEFMRHESLCILREFEKKSVDHKLLILEFFVRAFALAGDVESCLALRYDALVLRELKATKDHQLHVSYGEWFTFTEHALDNRFYVIARKACEKSLACFERNDIIGIEGADVLSKRMEAIEKIKRLKDIATVTAASQSVQAQAVEYLNRKTAKPDKDTTFIFKEKLHSASILYRNGIKKHNTRKLQELRKL